MSKGYFQSLPPEERKLIGQKGGQSQRSEAVEAAWAGAEALRTAYKDGSSSIKELAKAAGVSYRTMYRIIRGK